MNQNQLNKIDYNECDSVGICSISPSLAFLHEVIKSYIAELAFYLLKLKGFGITNSKIKGDIIEGISGMLIGVSYSEEQFSKVITKFSADLKEAKELYTLLCEKNKVKPEFIKSQLKVGRIISISEAIRQGQKIFTSKNIKITAEEKNLFELMYYVVKSICIHLIELRTLDFDDEEYYGSLLELFNVRASSLNSLEKSQETLEEAVKLDHLLLLKLQEKREEKYGQIVPIEVSRSTRPNKAILVSGTNVRELELILEATKDKGIDVYTHGRMIMAHAFPKLKKYPNLVGHFGTEPETYLLDFVGFPGAIFMTRHSFHKVEGICRSRLFTSDAIAPMGVITIKDNNYEPLIKSALSAKGFTKGVQKPSVKINLNEKKILNKITEVAEKIENGEIKHFFAIGISNRTKNQKEYFEKFLNLLGDDCFGLSFSYTNDKNNMLLVESDYGFPLLYKTLDILTRKITLSDLKPIILYTRCEAHTISNVLYMKYIGINKIYFTDCSPNLINPSLVQAMREMCGLKKYKNPHEDFKEMIEG